jgi:O-antigen/teichoic acid export membrane protein
MRKAISIIWQKHHEKSLVFFDQAIVSGSNFLIGILISKAFGLHDLGVYTFAWMMLMMCSSLQQSFISIPMINEYARKAGHAKKEYLEQLFIMQLMVSFGMALVCFLGITFLQKVAFFEAIHGLVIVLPVLVFFYTLYDFFRRVYFLRSNLLKVVILDTLINWSQVGFLLAATVWHNFTLNQMVSFFACTYLLGFFMGTFEFFRIKHFGLNIFHLFIIHWKLTSWLLASAVLQWFAGNFFIISAGSLLGAEAAGVVRIAQSIIGVLNVFFIALEMYVPVKAAQLYTLGGRKQLFKYTRKVLFIGLGICTLFALVIWGTSAQLLTWLYGIHYAQFSHVITLFAFFYIIVFVGYPLRFALRALDNTKAMFFAYVLATGFSLLFSNMMVTAWGIWGVLAGLAGTQVIMQLWYVKELVWQPTNRIV